MSSESADRIRGNVLLVGSLPFDDVENALRAGADGLRGHAAMLPDGEVGPRKYFVGFLRESVLADHPQLEDRNRPAGGVVEQPDRDSAETGVRRGGEAEWTFRIKPGKKLRFDDLKYGQCPIHSYKVFDRLRREGVIEPHVRFQVGLPTAISAMNSFLDDPADWPEVHRAYTEAMAREIEKCSRDPAGSLAIQYELCWEVIDLSMGEENFIPFWPKSRIEEKLAARTKLLPDLTTMVPDEAVLSYHLCYGTWGAWPMSAMENLRLRVYLSSAIVSASDRSPDYIHMPVVRHPDEAFVALLGGLNIGDTKVFPGIIQHTDGVDGFKPRFELARRYLADFGVASVCGYGRVEADELPRILRVHRECAGLVPGIAA